MRLPVAIVAILCLLAAPAMAQRAAGPAALAAPTQLVATVASKTAVSLSWTGPSSPARFIVERKAAGAAWPTPGPTAARAGGAPPSTPTPSTIQTVDATTANDTTIDAFGTYVYRVRTLGAGDGVSAPSNEITVGPPPTGFSQVAATPRAMQDHDPSQFGAVLQMTLDANGDPALAYLVSDANNDGALDDSELYVITWNRARYRWNAASRIAVVGDVVRRGSTIPFSLARDASNGRFAVAYMIGQHQISLGLSDDLGVTWTSSVVDKTSEDVGSLTTPSLGAANGQAFLAYFHAGVGVQYLTGRLGDAPSGWPRVTAPLLPGTGEARAEGVTLGLDASLKPAVIYWLNPSDGSNLTLAFWRPGGDAVKVADSNNHQTDEPSAHLAFAGTQAAVLMFANRDEAFFDNHHLWFARSADNGGTWQTPVVVADDGGNAMGPPIAVVLDRAGHPAGTAEMAGGNDTGTKCGVPKLMRSTDGVRWTTCAPGTKGAPTPNVTFPIITMAGNDKIYLAFKMLQPAGGLGAGLVLWREP
jgi:hypothetical protein